MAMRDTNPKPLATSATPMAARHVGRGPGLVDEDQPVGIEIELILEPLLAPDQNVGTVLFSGVRGLFLRVMAWRAKKRWIVPKPKARPCSARLARTSSMVASLPGPSAAITASWCASIRSERRSPPSRPGRGSPCSRARLRHRLTLAALTPKRSAASRCVAPDATAPKTRTRRSTDSARDMPAGLHPANSLNHVAPDLGIPLDSLRSGSALKLRITARRDRPPTQASPSAAAAASCAARSTVWR